MKIISTNLKKTKQQFLIILIIILSTANVFAYNSANELAENEKCVENIATWITTNIHYYNDAENSCHWQKSKETLKLGTGDCKDFATLFYDSIQCFGYNARIYLVNYNIDAHAICIFKNREGYWQIFDTSGLRRLCLNDIGQLVRYTFLGCNNYYEINPLWKY